MVEKAVIDRFEGKQAVLLVEEKPVNILRSALPVGVKEGDWLEVEFVGERMVSAKVDPGETERMKARIAEKLAQLRRGGNMSTQTKRVSGYLLDVDSKKILTEAAV